MDIQTIGDRLNTRFGDLAEFSSPDAWQVEATEFRLLVLLSEDQSWLRMLIPIMPAAAAQPFLSQILAENFDQTQQARYALHQDVLWGVFHHERASLTAQQFDAAIDRLLVMKQVGIDPFFEALAEQQISQIIQAAKIKGQSLEETMQTLDRFYSEGVMGNMTDGQSREQVLEAWRRQLERLWAEVD